MALDVGSWARGPVAERDTRTAQWLKAHGWKAATAGPGEPIASVWQELGTATRATDALLRRPTIASGEEAS
jgi:hypothetical protein